MSPTPPRTRPLTVAAAVVILVVAGLYLLDPYGFGSTVFFVTAGVSVLAVVIGPLVHRPRPLRPWVFLAVGCACFMVGVALRQTPASTSTLLESADLWAIAGYACTAVFLIELVRQTMPRDSLLGLDVAAIVVGAVLVGWVLDIGSTVRRGQVGVAGLAISASYPVMDTILLLLVLLLAFRRGRGNPSLEAIVISVTTMLIGDAAYSFIWVQHPGVIVPWASVFHLVAYATMGLGVSLPSIRELSQRQVVTTKLGRGRELVIFIALMVPAATPLMLPTYGVLDSVVRGLLVATLGVIVFIRLRRTIDALHKAEETVRRRATSDTLTGLPNRLALSELIEERLAGPGSARAAPLWLMLIDFDNFRQVNDGWGYGTGNEVLQIAARRLQSTFTEALLVARSGGDQFAVVCEHRQRLPESAAMSVLARGWRDIPLSAGRRTLITPTVGIVESPDCPGSAEELMRSADIALHHAKGHAEPRVSYFDASIRERTSRRHELANSLRTAIDDGQISIAYQPICTGPGFADLAGWEALARWTHPQLGTINPAEFVPIAEDTDLIIQLGEFILDRALHQLARWQVDFGRPDLHMAVNVSPVQLLRTDVSAAVRTALDDTGISPADLWVEITESVALEQSDLAMHNVAAVNASGVVMCVDDFGTGYSSLNYLRTLGVKVLKIDKSFTAHVTTDDRDRRLINAIVDLSQALGLDAVIAEGVETEEQAQALQDLECTHAQGFLFGEPVAAQPAAAQARRLVARRGTGEGAVPGAQCQDPGTLPGPGTMTGRWR
ncbi:MAG: putative bifunctional diguanylate cyclase/phosphodiesterase [Actinomycetales bacterium]